MGFIGTYKNTFPKENNIIPPAAELVVRPLFLFVAKEETAFPAVPFPKNGVGRTTYKMFRERKTCYAAHIHAQYSL